MTEICAMTVEEAIKSPLFMYARQGTRLYRNITWIYIRDVDSPTGVILAASGPSNVVDELIRKYQNTSALSPDER